MYNVSLVRLTGILLMAPAALCAQTPVFLNINPLWSPDGGQLVFESALRLLFSGIATGVDEVDRGSRG